MVVVLGFFLRLLHDGRLGGVFDCSPERNLLLSGASSQPLVERRRFDAGVLAGQQDVASHRLIEGA